ncbi:Hypothetical protein, putative [Bodo saltans]|uniref:Uncharacterized protein n=1 Tax=Bodo saltans TaxID=75058 RepID=A0A0S4JJ50_BODSA|nr:Hypothetical protein, putative [Bodo saltans]|eukprot:CUG90192.1 Hypothetical protein, putative [Bodo saltans]
MLRRSGLPLLCVLRPSAEAVASALERLRSSSNLDDVCTILSETGSDAQVAQRGMQLLTQYDSSAEDSAAIAQGVGLNAVLGVLAGLKHASDQLEAREQCCRAIANMCMLSATTSATSSSSATTSDQQQQAAVFADLLVEGKAVELVLGVMSEQLSLSASSQRETSSVLIGQRRTAMALTNLIMFSQNGASKAIEGGAEATVAQFLSSIIDAGRTACFVAPSPTTSSGQSLFQTDPVAAAELFSSYGRRRLRRERTDVRFSAMEAPDNAAGVQYRYQLLESSSTLEAVLSAVVLFSTPWRPAALEATAKSSTSSAAIAQIVAAGAAVPILHKSWEYLRTVAAHAPNHALIFDELFAAGFAAPPAYRSQSALWTAPIRIAEYDSVVATKSSGAAPEDDSSVASLAPRLHDAFIDFITEITAARKDVKAPIAASDATSSSTTGNSDDDNTNSSSGTSAILPTESAQAVVDVLQDGVVSAYSLGVLSGCARFWDSLATTSSSSLSQRRRCGDVAQRHVALLTNFCETDAVAVSENTFAIVESLLRSYISLSSSTSTSSNVNEEGNTSSLSVELLPVVARAFSLIWNALNTNQGRDAMQSTGLSAAVREIVKAAEARTLLSSGAPVDGPTDAAKSTNPATDTATVLAQKTFDLGVKLVEKLDAVLDKPKYVQSKYEGGPQR